MQLQRTGSLGRTKRSPGNILHYLIFSCIQTAQAKLYSLTHSCVTPLLQNSACGLWSIYLSNNDAMCIRPVFNKITAVYSLVWVERWLWWLLWLTASSDRFTTLRRSYTRAHSHAFHLSKDLISSSTWLFCCIHGVTADVLSSTVVTAAILEASCNNNKSDYVRFLKQCDLARLCNGQNSVYAYSVFTDKSCFCI